MSGSSSSPSPSQQRPEPAWTDRQREVLDLLLRGRTNPEIATALGISLDGAKWHVSEVITKLGVDSRDEAAEYWRAHNDLRLRFTRMLHALVSSLWLKVAGGIALAAGASVAIAVVVVALHNSGSSQVGIVATASTTPASASAVLTVALPTATSTSVPPFVGTLNGLAIDPSWRGRTPLELCPSGTIAPAPPGTAETVTRAVGPLRIDPSRLPAGTVSVVTPDAFLCDGTLAQVSWALTVPTPQGTPGAPVFISRIRGLEPIQQAAPIGVWQAIAVKGHAGVGFAGTDSPAGHCWVGLYDDSIDVFTTVSAERGGTLTPCIDIASALID